MRKFAAIILVIASVVFSVCGCGNNKAKNEAGLVEYNELGLTFVIPQTFVRKDVPYAQSCFGDRDSGGSGYFYFSVYSADGLENDLYLPGDITVKDYMAQFIGWNNISKDYSYDVKRDIASVDYVFHYDDGEMEDEYYLHVVMRGTDHLYVITMSCANADLESYKQVFTDIRASLVAQ